jgi:hypothetical protein
MGYAVGLILAAAVGAYGTAIGFDKERSFYAVVLNVVASYYILFAVMAGSMDALRAEAFPALLFIAVAGIGFRRAPWLIVAGLALHGLFDAIHQAIIANPGVPEFWPGFCLGYDIAAAAYLAVLIVVRRPHSA